MAIVSSFSRHRSLLLRRLRLRHLRLLSSSSTPSTPPPPPPSPPSITTSAADKSLSIPSSDYAAFPVSGRDTIDLVVRRLAKSRRFSDIEALIESRKKDPEASQEPYVTTLIISYGVAGMIDHALRTFDEMDLLGAPRTVVSFNALLYACNHSKNSHRVPDLFTELSRKHSIAPDKVSYGILIKSFCLSGKTKNAFLILKEMEEKEIEVNTITYTTIMDSLYKEGKPKEAKKLWKEMISKGCVPDSPAYTARVVYHALHGKPEDVLELIREMESAGLKPETITYNYLITCYCKNKRFDDAKEVYKGFEEKGCSRNATTYKNYLGLLCKNGDFGMGLEVWKDSIQQNKVPDFETMKLLVKGLVKGAKVEMANRVIEEMKKWYTEDLLSRWKNFEKELGLNADGEASDQVEDASV